MKNFSESLYNEVMDLVEYYVNELKASTVDSMVDKRWDKYEKAKKDLDDMKKSHNINPSLDMIKKEGGQERKAAKLYKKFEKAQKHSDEWKNSKLSR